MSEQFNLIDTHCHVHFSDYDNDRDTVLADASAVGVNRLICVGCSLEDSKKAVDFAKDRSGIWATAGAHPHDGADYLGDHEAEGKLKNLLASSKVVAVGEIGLDYYRDITPKPDQEKTLRSQIEIGLGTNLPFVFHVREAWDDFWKIFDSYKSTSRQMQGVIHSFSAPKDRLLEVLERGLYVSLNGLMTYAKDESWLEAAKKVPADKLILETDAPFLTPVPFRGRRCEPKHVVETCRFLASLRNEEPMALAYQSTKNAIKLFGLGEEKLA